MLTPLVELSPGLVIPGVGPAADALAALADDGGGAAGGGAAGRRR